MAPPMECASAKMRRRAIRQHHLFHGGFEIGDVFGKIAHMTLLRVGERALGQALPAPVEGRDGKAARAQVAHGLVIFFDVFGAALQDDDGALAAGGGAKRAKRNVTSSRVVSAPTTAFSGTGLAGIETSRMEEVEAGPCICAL